MSAADEHEQPELRHQPRDDSPFQIPGAARAQLAGRRVGRMLEWPPRSDAVAMWSPEEQVFVMAIVERGLKAGRGSEESVACAREVANLQELKVAFEGLDIVTDDVPELRND